MSIDNMARIAPLLEFSSEDDYYHLQIIKRKKEHPELGSNSEIVRTYYVGSSQYLWDRLPDIRIICDMLNARACLNLNKRSFEKSAFHLLRKVAEQIYNKDFRSCRKAYESVTGANPNVEERRWIVDCDGMTETDVLLLGKSLNDIEPMGEKVLCLLPTKNGFHLITRPFNVQKANIGKDIHKDNPTLLYMSVIERNRE